MNKNLNFNNQAVNNSTGYECQNRSQFKANEYSGYTRNYESTYSNNLKNTYGCYNLASDSQKLNILDRNAPFSGSGPIRATGRFTNRSNGPYGRINKCS